MKKTLALAAMVLLVVLAVTNVYANGQKEKGKVSLRVMDWQSGGKDFWDKTDADFMALHPEITIVHEPVPYGQYFDKVGAYIAAKDGPDLMQLETGMGTLKYKDALVPLNKYLGAYVKDINGLDAFCEDFDATKNIYGVPHTNQGHMIYYNIKVFKEAGLDPAHPPKTWREMDAAVKAIRAVGKQPFAFGGKEWAVLWTFCSLPDQVITLEQKRGILAKTTKWTEAPLKNSISLLKYMIDNKWLSDGSAESSVTPEAQDMFTSGKAAFMNSIISDAFNWKLWGDTIGYDNFGVMKFPAIEKDYPLKGVSPVQPGASLMDLHGGIAFTLPKWSKNPDQAVLYIKYVTSPEVQTRYLLEGGAIPSNKKIDLSVVKAAQFKTIMKWVNEPGVTPPGLLYMSPREWDALIRQTQLMITGQANVDQFARAMQEAQDQR